MNAENVKKFWHDRAENYNDYSTVSATYDDIHRRELENYYINTLLPDHGYSLLDVGCGTGYGTKKFANRFEKVKGIDFASGMIERAKKENPHINIKYEVSDIVKMDTSEKYDFIISQRVIQNIPTVSDQHTAIKNIHDSLNPNGYYIFCECIADTRDAISNLRMKLGLDPLPDLHFNFEFNYKETKEFLSKYFTIEEDINLGLYDFISKVIYPASCYPNGPKFNSNVNSMISKMMMENKEYTKYFNEFCKTFLLKLRKK